MASGTSSALECFETFRAKSFKNLFYIYEETVNLIETFDLALKPGKWHRVPLAE